MAAWLPPIRLIVLVALVATVLATAETEAGLEHLREGRIDEALSIFSARLEENPEDVTALNMVGAILCMKDEPRNSIAYFERALRHAPDFVPARKNLAIAEFELGRYESAEAHLNVLIADPQVREQASLFLGMIASESGRHESAVELLTQAGNLATDQPRSQIAYARSLHRVGRHARAEAVLATVRARGDLSAPDLVDVAQVASESGHFEAALADLGRAEILDPALMGLGSRRIDLLVKSGRHDEALEVAGRVAGRVPSRGNLSRLAGLAERAGDLDAAVEALRKAIQAEPTAEDGYIELSEFCVRYRNPGLALEILDLGLGRIPKSYRLLVQKGITLGQGQRYEAARQAFSDAIAVTPDHSVALTALAVSLILSEEMPRALQTLRDGVERFPDDFYMHYMYGFALDRSRAEGVGEDRAALARNHLRRSIKLNGEFASAYYQLGKLLADTDPAAAIRNLETAVELDPLRISAKYQLGQLYLDAGRRDAGARLMQEVGAAKQLELEQEQLPQFRAVKTPRPAARESRR